MGLPKYAAFKNDVTGKYLRYIHEGSLSGNLQYSSDKVVSMFSKFELEPAKTGNFVNIRCCYNNKYWASSNDENYLVTPFVDKPKENKSSWPYTLFEFVPTSYEGGYYLLDVWRQSFVCRCNTSKIHEHCLTTRYGNLSQICDRYLVIIDFEKFVVFPKHVAFKGDNGRYLSAYWHNDWEYLQFDSNDIGSLKVSHEVINMGDGSIRIKNEYWKKFWKREPNWILANSTDTTANNINTLFWPVKVSKNVVALRSLANDKYCIRYTADGKENCLNSRADSIVKEAEMTIVEPIISREIYNVKYRMKDVRVYNEKILTMATSDATNGGTEPTNMTISFKYVVENTKCWEAALGLSLEVAASLNANIPKIGDAGVEANVGFNAAYNWGKTITETNEVAATYTVNVPANTTMRVTLLATKGACNVPFSYTQRDVMRKGKQVITDHDDGVFIGVNCYKFTYSNKPMSF